MTEKIFDQREQNYEGAKALGFFLGSLVNFILYSAVLAIPMKYIFAAYFHEIGWIPSVSYLTVFMSLFFIKTIGTFVYGRSRK